MLRAGYHTHLEGEVRFDQAQDQQVVTTRSPRIVTECLLSRSMLIKMYVYAIYSRFCIGTILSIRTSCTVTVLTYAFFRGNCLVMCLPWSSLCYFSSGWQCLKYLLRAFIFALPRCLGLIYICLCWLTDWVWETLCGLSGIEARSEDWRAVKYFFKLNSPVTVLERWL